MTPKFRRGISENHYSACCDILHCFQEKQMTKFSKKNPKYHFLTLFAQSWAQITFLQKSGSVKRFMKKINFMKKMRKK